MEQIKMTMRKRAGKIYDVFLGEMHLFTASSMVAEPICTSFNEHDTLKAKAELFDHLKGQIVSLDKLARKNPTNANEIVFTTTGAILDSLKKKELL